MPSATLPMLLLRNAGQWPERVAMREKEYGIWQCLTWAALLARVRDFALGLRRLGIERGDKVAILGDNRPEWVIAELAAHCLGGVSMGVYQDSVASEVQFLLDWSDARIAIAEDQEQIDKLLEIWPTLPKLEHVVYYDPKGLGHYRERRLLPFPEVEARGREGEAEQNHAELQAAVAATQADDVAIFSTTSGTTGKPKLAMLTHRNLITMAHNLQEVDRAHQGMELVSFLPLAWIGEQMTAVACALSVGLVVNFPEEPETVQENIREIGPHLMFSPPRIWENLVSEVQVKIEDASWLKGKIFAWANEAGKNGADARRERRRRSLLQRSHSALANALCLFWIRDKLGLRRVRWAYTGGAALGPDVFRFFHALGVNLKQIYGQTEVSGISVVHRDGDLDPNTVGTPLPNTEVRLAADGEVLTRGPAVFVGYYKNEEATREALRDGWLHSGDAGTFDERGHLTVIDRAKDVMTLADGTRFSPQFIENKLKFSPHVREAVVFGGGAYPFVAALLNIDFANTGKWAERHQLAYTTFTDLAQKPAVYALIREHVERTNEVLPVSARIRRFLLLHKELDADDAELTRTRKVRRGFIAERYSHLVAALYGTGASLPMVSEITYQDGRTARIEIELRIETVLETRDETLLEHAER